MSNEAIDTGLEIQDQPIETNAPQVATSTTEETLSKSRVNEIVHQRTKEASQKAYERGRQEALKSQQQPQGTMGGMPQMTEDQLRSMMADEFQKQSSQQHQTYQKQQVEKQLNDLANNFMGKIVAAKEIYPDLEKRQDEISEFASLIPFINESEQAAGITQHLLDNGHNLASLLVLQQASPSRLRYELKKLADSIKTNDVARNRTEPNEPLYEPSPSNNTMGSGSSSIESLKGQDWLRG